MSHPPLVPNPRYALIVDDDPAILDVYEMALSDLGFVPVLASNGAKALEEAEKLSPAVVIVDQRMPGITGFELVAKIRARGAPECPVIMVTASHAYKAAALSAGISTFLEKPFDIDDLIRAVHETTSHVAA